MTILHDLTTSQLKHIISIKEQIEKLHSQIESIAVDAGEMPTPTELRNARGVAAKKD
ncbi:MAG: hypothetical protein ABSG04_07865 [Verrucomicrobiota bacterium]|jgi:hypothetical protein